MPVMTSPGAHLQVLLDNTEFHMHEQREKAKAATIRAECYEEAARALRRAIEEEAKKLPPGVKVTP